MGDADDEQDDDSYLSDYSPRKGKAPASRKRRMKKQKDTSNHSSKRIKTEYPTIVDDLDSDNYSDSDIEIDEERSCPRTVKAEPMDLTQLTDIEIGEERTSPRVIKEEPMDLTQVADFEIDEERSSPRVIKVELMDLTQVGLNFL